ncbi:nucleoside/nucleotide kinase family protein [Roseovarius mucosus]|uniref:nucleoside/nucleotide kinase family protein n=1 Tax=Roseovarius mucosus TaxID=215743 RepID=UPI003F6EF599
MSGSDTDTLLKRLLDRPTDQRTLCAIIGPPGSGKTTFADRLAADMNARRPGLAAILQMDGFHYDDLHLVPAGLRARKGAPETFDVGGLRQTLTRLRARDEDQVAVPVFDRELEVARAGARLIPAQVQLVLIEGNYLLLGRAPWSGLHPLFDLTVRLDVPEHILRARLTQRWQRLGLAPDEVTAKVEGNDLPNGRFVRDASVATDIVIRQSE